MVLWSLWHPRLTVLVLLGGLWWCSSARAQHPAAAYMNPPYGPLRLVNQQPLQLLFLQLFPDVATPVYARHALIHLNLALSNTIEQQRQDFTADLDLEMVRTVVDVRYGVLSHLEVGLELPFLYTYSGILDHFINGVEETFGGERFLRETHGANEFRYEVLRGQQRFIHGRDSAFGIGDVVLKLKAPLLGEGTWRPVLSVRAAVKFPTGSASRAFGSGEFDGALGVLLQKTFARLTVYVNGDVTFPGEAYAEVDVQPFFSGIAAGEYRLGHNVSLVIQVRGDTRPFHDTIPILDKRILEVMLGANWALSHSLILQGGFTENILDSPAADVNFFVNLTGRL